MTQHHFNDNSSRHNSILSGCGTSCQDKWGTSESEVYGTQCYVVDYLCLQKHLFCQTHFEPLKRKRIRFENKNDMQENDLFPEQNIIDHDRNRTNRAVHSKFNFKFENIP